MHRTVLVNDDGWLMYSYRSPVTPADFREQMVATYRDTPVEALLWCIGDHEVYHIETEVGDVYGADEGRDATPGDETRVATIQQLVREHGGPLTAMAKVCRDEGMRLFASVRMNSHYEKDPSSLSYSRMRVAHPEWLIGHGGELTPGSVEGSIRTRSRSSSRLAPAPGAGYMGASSPCGPPTTRSPSAAQPNASGTPAPTASTCSTTSPGRRSGSTGC